MVNIVGFENFIFYENYEMTFARSVNPSPSVRLDSSGSSRLEITIRKTRKVTDDENNRDEMYEFFYLYLKRLKLCRVSG